KTLDPAGFSLLTGKVSRQQGHRAAKRIGPASQQFAGCAIGAGTLDCDHETRLLSCCDSLFRPRADRHSQASRLIEVDNGDNGRATARAPWPVGGPGAMPPPPSPRRVLARVLSRAAAKYPRL